MAEAANCYIAFEGGPTLADLVAGWNKRVADCQAGLDQLTEMAKTRGSSAVFQRARADLKAFNNRVNTVRETIVAQFEGVI